MQNYYSKRTVEKLKTQLHCAEQNFSSTLSDNEKLGAEIVELKAENERYYTKWQDSIAKIASLETQLGLRKSYNEGRDMAAIQVKRTAMRRAHEELHKVKSTEENARILHRAIGNAQGILAAAIDANRSDGESYAEPISLYPADEKAERDEMRRNPGMMYRG